MKEIIFLNPVFKERIWGGNLLRSDFGYEIPSETTGECWAVSAHEHGDCTCESKSLKGKTLSDLWKNNRELFGSVKGEQFPLLIKIIDAKDDLSIQVHPDDEYAGKNENGSFGKTECWYILDCKEDAQIVVGHNAKNKEQLEEMIREDKWNELISVRPIKKGDFFQITPGTVHAIKGGTVILETQQNSDITYRLYDYGRLENGKPRELHLEKSIDVIKSPFEEPKYEKHIQTYEGGTVEQLVECEYYTVRKIDVNKTVELSQEEQFTILSVIEGEGTIDDVCIKKGDHFVLPNGYGNYKINGNISLILSFCE